MYFNQCYYIPLYVGWPSRSCLMFQLLFFSDLFCLIIPHTFTENWPVPTEIYTLNPIQKIQNILQYTGMHVCTTKLPEMVSFKIYTILSTIPEIRDGPEKKNLKSGNDLDTVSLINQFVVTSHLCPLRSTDRTGVEPHKHVQYGDMPWRKHGTSLFYVTSLPKCQ